MISCVINVDTRPERSNDNGMFNGVVSRDFLTDNIYNKIKFLNGFDKEIIVFIDEHVPVPAETIEYLRSITDCIVIRKHTDENKFNDNNYIAALSIARGEYVFHFDQDVSAFTISQEPINNILSLLQHYDYISYPSQWSPNAVHDPNYDYMWASTRFFACKRETLDFTEIKKCLFDNEYLYGNYPASVRNPWTEHILGLIAKYKGRSVYYPPINLGTYTIFTWGNYRNGTLQNLNKMIYEQVRIFIELNGGIQYPANIYIK